MHYFSTSAPPVIIAALPSTSHTSYLGNPTAPQGAVPPTLRTTALEHSLPYVLLPTLFYIKNSRTSPTVCSYLHNSKNKQRLCP
jgi:hypothetical protein